MRYGLIILILCLFQSTVVSCCFKSHLPIEAQILESKSDRSTIFRGTVIAIVDDTMNQDYIGQFCRQVVFNIHESWFGLDTNIWRLSVALEGLSIDYHFVLDSTYIVFGWKTTLPHQRNPHYSTGLCTLTCLVSDGKEILPHLGNGVAHKTPIRLCDSETLIDDPIDYWVLVLFLPNLIWLVLVIVCGFRRPK
ncbi:MAG: hypothetical protein ACI8SE_001707 [Bacteroidia bacterium]|jgi:hypothetical protein